MYEQQRNRPWLSDVHDVVRELDLRCVMRGERASTWLEDTQTAS